MEKKNQIHENDLEYQDSYDKINTDVLLLTDRLRITKDKIRKTPWYSIICQWKLYKELEKLEKEVDKIENRLKKIEQNPIQIVKRP